MAKFTGGYMYKFDRLGGWGVKVFKSPRTSFCFINIVFLYFL